RRDLAVHDPAHDVPRTALDPGELQLHRDARAGVLRAHARAHLRDDRRVRGARSLPLLRDVGRHAHPDVLHHRRVGRTKPAVRGDQVLHLHVLRIAADAGGDPDARLPRRPAHRRLLVLLRQCDEQHRRVGARGVLVIRCLLSRVRDQGPDVSVPHLAPGRPCRGADGGLGDPRRGPAEDGDVRLPALCGAVLPSGGAPPGRAGGDRHAVPERVRRGIPRAAGGVPNLSRRRRRGDHRRDRGGDVPPAGAAAGDLQPARPARERAPCRPVTARARGATAARRLHRVDRRVPDAVPAAHGAERAAIHRVRPARRAGRGRAMNVDVTTLDLSRPGDLLIALAPELVLTTTALLVLLVVAWRHRTPQDLRLARWVTLSGLGAAGLAAWFLWWQAARAVGIAAMIAVDDFRFVADWLFLGTAALTVLVSFEYLEREALLVPEYFAMLLFATLGMMLMAGAQDLTVLFLGLELMSISVYVLAGINRRSAAAAEAALKYFLLGAFASGFLLYGIALVYVATATTNLTQIGVQVRTVGLDDSPMLLIGRGLLLVGFGLKVAAVPFHMWAPDVYDGPPTPIAGYMATAVKAAAFAALFRVLGGAFAAVP